MAYATIEPSNTGGIPIALYEIKRGNTTYRYTSADRDITMYGNVYTSTPISDSGVKISGDPNSVDLTVSLPADNPVAVWFTGTPPSGTVYLSIRRMHYGDSDAPYFWIGSVSSSSRPNRATAQLVCYPIGSTFKQDGQRLRYGLQCPHTLFGPGCNLSASDFSAAGIITALTGNTVTADVFAQQPDGRYSGGYIQFNFDPESLETRGITTHTGTTVEVYGATDGLSVGQAITVFPGCAHSFGDCVNFFNNGLNYGGFPWLAGRSPFDNEPVY